MHGTEDDLGSPGGQRRHQGAFILQPERRRRERTASTIGLTEALETKLGGKLTAALTLQSQHHQHRAVEQTVNIGGADVEIGRRPPFCAGPYLVAVTFAQI